MAENSKIEWCHHTFNPWRGCRAISDACANCYAKVLVEGRLQQDFGVRTRAAASTWKQPLAWNRKAAKEGVRYRVFCASLADVFDAEVPDEWRDDLFALIDQTPNLDWLLLTKRPAVARKVMPAEPRPNVWLGTTVEDQKMADARIPHLLATPAAVRFLSMEPLLGPVDLSKWLGWAWSWDSMRTYTSAECHPRGNINRYFENDGGERCAFDGHEITNKMPLDWVITGGESGPGARPSHPDWFRSVRDQCTEAAVPFLFKQWGEWAPGANFPDHIPSGQSHNFGDDSLDDDRSVWRVGKKAAGRHLDGVLHDGYPVPA